MSASKKGDRRERELVNKLYEDEFGVTRIPSSGSSTQRELPDILAGNGDIYIAIESKASGGSPIYIKGKEVEELIKFANKFGAKARIAVRFDYEKWYFFHPSDLHVTNGGNYRVKKEEALENGIDYNEQIGKSTQTKL